MVRSTTTAFVIGVATLAACAPDPIDPTMMPAGLVLTETIAAGDDACPDGGVRILTGLDNGDGDGTALDGILQPGEMDRADVVCQVLPPVEVPPDDSLFASTDPPEGDPGTGRLALLGGPSQRRTGGLGGTLKLVTSPNPSPYGHVAVFPTGRADTSFVMPNPTDDFGLTPWILQGDETLLSLPEDATPPGGSHYATSDNLGVVYDADAQRRITGLHVPAGTTLTLSPVNAFTTRLEIAGPLVIDGTLAVARLPSGDTPDLQIDVRYLVVGPEGHIDLQGDDGLDGAAGKDGGTLIIKTGRSITTTPVPGHVRMQGTVHTSGGAGDPAGISGLVDVETQSGIWSTGRWVTDGADSLGTGHASEPGTLSFAVASGPAIFHGSMSYQGGQGGEVATRGGFVEILADRAVLDLTITANAGSPTACTTACDGAQGGVVLVRTEAASISAHLDMTAHGSDGVGTAGALLSEGGSGGFLQLIAGATAAQSTTWAPRVTLSGAISLQGGAGQGDGGPGGVVDLQILRPYDRHSEIRVLGMSVVDVRGGDSATDTGGTGGLVLLEQGSQLESAAPTSGGVLLDVDVVAHGGQGSVGGRGGTLQLRNRVAVGLPDEARVVRHAATFDASGGQGVLIGGSAGQVSVQAGLDVLLLGDMIGHGGDATDANGRGGHAGSSTSNPVEVTSTRGEITVEGTIDYAGGDNEARGGNGGTLLMDAPHIIVTGAMASIGGVAADGIGGNGGTIALNSFGLASDVRDATFDVAGGDGRDLPGNDGLIYVDGLPIDAWD